MNAPRLPRPAAPVTLPALIGRLGGKLPLLPGAALFATGLNLALRPALPADVRAALQDRHLRIRVLDAGLAFDVAWQGSRFVPRAHGAVPDLDIAANAADLLALMRRETDPDTLFFGRRLSMQGDTELGLLVKNTLDALELTLPDLHPLALLRWLRDSRSGFRQTN
ncbi:SCP2 sterol-binding domain-containing protein [[Empedobacter] haloabium]|uniref:Ubiquinone biosynthesis accessory factor UbiT n=1 Tax=[Empedobacter] haloabium TaxID=592317 RepID=A0ABZ1UDH0_9BURK